MIARAQTVVRQHLERLSSRLSNKRHVHTPTHDIRNIALVAHIGMYIIISPGRLGCSKPLTSDLLFQDSGKTTLTESILHKSNYLTAPGSVDTGSTTTDFLPAERERGITIQSASIPVKWKQYTYNLIDTPGHADFGMEVESASRVVDGAVVLLDSVEGVEAQTRGVWRQLDRCEELLFLFFIHNANININNARDRYNVPTRLLFLNKLDRPGASLHHSYMSVLANHLHPQPVILTLPVSSFNPKHYETAEPGIEGIVDLVKWEVWQFKPDLSQPVCTPLPTAAMQDWSQKIDTTTPFPPSHPLIPHLPQARIQLLDSLSMHSEELLDHLLSLSSNPSSSSSYLSVPSEMILSVLRKATLRQTVLPVLCGSALKHVGTDILLDYVGHLLADPLDAAASAQIDTSDHQQVQLLAWKVTWDKRLGWMTYVRVYSGM